MKEQRIAVIWSLSARGSKQGQCVLQRVLQLPVKEKKENKKRGKKETEKGKINLGLLKYFDC